MAEQQQICLIIDSGSYSMKVGLTTDDGPKITEPTQALKLNNFQNEAVQIIFGQEAVEKQEMGQISNLIERGVFQDFVLLKQFYQQTCQPYFQSQNLNYPVMTNYYPNTSKLQKEKQAQLFFEEFNVPYYFTASNSLLILYSSGKITGLVVDSGDKVTSLVPVLEGNPMYCFQTILNFGGSNITNYIQSQLEKVTKETAIQIKEKYCRVSLDYKNEISELNKNQNQNMITLPDGSPIDLRDSIITSTETLFNSQVQYYNIQNENTNTIKPNFKIKQDYKQIPFQQLVLDTINKTEAEQKKAISSNIILGGGNTCFMNFNERLQRELFGVYPSTWKAKCTSFTDKVNALWFGGIIISSLGSFQPLWVTRNEYEEYGPVVICRKSI